MVSKDQTIGVVIFAVCVVIGVLYTAGLFYFGSPFGDPSWTLQEWLVTVPVFIAFIAIMGIGAWIGWTMATTPPPKPIEEITSEIESEQKKTAEEKTGEDTNKTEAPPETQEPAPEPPKAEEKKTERRRKSSD